MKMCMIEITGKHSWYEMKYAGRIIGDDGSVTYFDGVVNGSKAETEVMAVGIALKFAYMNNINTIIQTDLESAIDWANGKWKPNTKAVKDYLKLLKKTTERVEIRINLGMPADVLADLHKRIEQGKDN